MSSARAVLVGCDLSAVSDEAICHAHRWAVARQARMFVCHVVHGGARINLLFPGDSFVASEHLAAHPTAEEVTRRVVHLTSRSPEDFDVIVDRGSPHDILVRRADEYDVALIVVGGSSHGALGKLFGGVAERVVRHAHVPVLVAKHANGKGRVLVATDFSDHSFPAVAAAVAESHLRGAQLHVVHCIRPSTSAFGAYPGALGAPGPERVDLALATELHLERDARRRMEAAVRRFSATAELHVAHGAPGPSIRALAGTLHPELVVVGTAGRTGLRRALLGSVAEHVLRHAEQPTLVVRLAGNDRADTVDGPSLHAS